MHSLADEICLARLSVNLAPIRLGYSPLGIYQCCSRAQACPWRGVGRWRCGCAPRRTTPVFVGPCTDGGTMMNIFRKIIDGVAAMLLFGGFFVLGVPLAEVESGRAQPNDSLKWASNGPRPETPGVGRPLYSPPAMIDRAPPMSERPSAKPFLDPSPSIADRPLAPIGGGVRMAPDVTPFLWCSGVWIRGDVPPYRCPPP